MANLATLTVTLTGAVSPLQAALAQAERSTARTLGAMQSSASGAATTMTRALGSSASSVQIALTGVGAGAQRAGSALSGALASGAHVAQSALRAAVSAAQSVTGALGNIAHVALSVTGSALRSLGRIAEYAAGQLLAMGIARAAGSVRQALSEYADYERLGMSLQALVARELMATGQAQDMARAMQLATGRAEDLRGWIEQLAIKSPFDQQGVAVAFRTALAYGFTTLEAQRLTRVMIDFAAATGQSSEVMDRIALALGQIKARGKLAGQEILQLTNAGLDVRDALSRALGRPRQEIEALIEAGIDADTAISAIVQTLERDFGGAAERQANTFSGLLSTLKDVQVVFRRALLGPAFRAAQPAVQRFVDTLQSPEVLARVSALGGRLGVLVARAVALGESLMLGRSLFDTESALGRVAGAFRAVVDFAASLVAGAVSLFRSGSLNAAINDFLKTLAQRMGVIAQVAQSTLSARIGMAVLRALDLARVLLARIVEVIAGAAQALRAGGLGALLAYAGETVARAVSAMIALARDRLLPAATALITDMVERARQAAPGLVSIVQDVIAEVGPRALSAAGTIIAGAARLAWSAMTDIADRAGDLLERAVASIAARAPAVVGAIAGIDWGGLLKQYLLGGASTPEEIAEWAIRTAITAAGSLIGGAIAGPAGAVAGGLLARWLIDLPVVQDLIQRGAQAAVDALRWLRDRGAEIAASPVWGEIAQGVSAAVTRAGELLRPFAERLGQFFQSVAGKVVDFFNRNRERFEKIAQGVVKIVEDIGKSPVWQTLYQIIYGAFDFVLKLVEGVLDTVLAAADTILALLSGDYENLGALLMNFAQTALNGVINIAWGALRFIVTSVRDLLAHLLDLITGWLGGLLGSLADAPVLRDLFGAQLLGARDIVLAAPAALRSIDMPAQPPINITINAPTGDAQAIADEALRALRLAGQVRP